MKRLLRGRLDARRFCRQAPDPVEHPPVVPFLSRRVGLLHETGNPMMQAVHARIAMAPRVGEAGLIQRADP